VLAVQSNLKFATQPSVTPILAVDFRGADLHKQLEQAALQRLLELFQSFSDGPSHGTQLLSSPYTKVRHPSTIVFTELTIALLSRSFHGPAGVGTNYHDA
jgi:hypothetical protein